MKARGDLVTKPGKYVKKFWQYFVRLLSITIQCEYLIYFQKCYHYTYRVEGADVANQCSGRHQIYDGFNLTNFGFQLKFSFSKARSNVWCWHAAARWNANTLFWPYQRAGQVGVVTGVPPSVLYNQALTYKEELGVASIGIEIGIGKVTAIGLQRAATHQCGGHICNRTKEAKKSIHVPLCKKQSILVDNVSEITRGPDSLVCNATKARLLATLPSSRPAVGPGRSRRCIDRP